MIELLAVIAIVAILGTFLLTAVSQTKKKAQQIRCEGNLQQLGVALKSFNADYGAYPLYANPGFSEGLYPEHHQVWDYAIQYEELAISKGANDFFAQGVWVCPAAPRPSAYPTNSEWLTYGYNAFGLGNAATTNSVQFGIGGNVTGPYTIIPIKEPEILNPSEMMAIGEVFDSNPKFWRNTNEVSGSNANSRHQGRANVVFCDGHVESPTLQFLFADTSDEALSRWNCDHLPHREKLAP
jgi:prepilin-type processing-associated H-X9-DG protein